MIEYRDHKRMYKKMSKEEGEQLNIDLGESPEIMKINTLMCMMKFM